MSPDGSRTFWTDYRDGKQAFFLGNAEGEDETELTALKDHAAYGWYTDDYVLLSKNGSELYIASTGKIANEAALTLVGSYYKPDITYRGYGGGYGGL